MLTLHHLKYLLRPRIVGLRAVILVCLMLISSALQATPSVSVLPPERLPGKCPGFKAGLANAGFIEGLDVTFIAGEQGADVKLQTRVAETFRNEGVDLVYS
ncbi:hypothetical protein [Aliamphritea spongicola]|nr:hypothetical protein [Aliamphritea spongicola]